ncbi:MAG: heme exporter protein CcmD [Burkholderiaceae bacterium]
MNWSSWPEFIGMGGYGLYVWGSLGLTAFVIAAEVWQVRARARALRHSAGKG